MTFLRRGLIVLLALVVQLCSLSVARAAYEKRVALVIGNGAYQHAMPLRNPVNDARSIEAKLKELGFLTVSGYDLSKDGMERTIRDFVRLSQDAGLTAFFYAGHGIAINDKNYLIPVDAAFQDATAIDFEAVPVDFVTRYMGTEDAAGLVFLDACRNNPLAEKLTRAMHGSSRALDVGSGLAEMNASERGKGLAIAFATSPETVALDGRGGGHSPFTESLLKYIGQPDTNIPTVMSLVTGDVYERTNKQQRPWLRISIIGDVVLNPTAKALAQGDGQDVASQVASIAPSAPVTSATTLELENALFSLARESQKISDYEAYLKRFPKGLFAENAKADIEALRLKETEAQAVQPQPTAVVSSRALNSASPASLVLPITPAVINAVADPRSEKKLELDRGKSREIQMRLNVAGYDVGRADGQFGRKSRSGLSAWQQANGLQPTGYLNNVQLQILMAQTQTAYSALPPEQVSMSTSRSSSTRKTYSGSRRNTSVKPEAIGRFVGSVLREVIR